MGSDVEIRDGGPADVEQMAAIAVEAWRGYYRHLRERMGEELFAAVCPGGAEEKGQHVRQGCDQRHDPGIAVAEIDGRAVAFVTFYVNVSPGVGEIGNNAVHPDFQGRGIGPRLYQHAVERLKAAGMRLVKVTTGLDPTHERARKAYEKVGFQPGEEAVTYYRRL